MTEKLLSYHKVKGFSSLLVFFVFIFCRVMTFIRYIGADFTLGLLDCARYNEDFFIQRFVISRFYSIHFTVTLAGLKRISFVIPRTSLYRGSLNRGSTCTVLVAKRERKAPNGDGGLLSARGAFHLAKIFGLIFRKFSVSKGKAFSMRMKKLAI